MTKGPVRTHILPRLSREGVAKRLLVAKCGVKCLDREDLLGAAPAARSIEFSGGLTHRIPPHGEIRGVAKALGGG